MLRLQSIYSIDVINNRTHIIRTTRTSRYIYRIHPLQLNERATPILIWAIFSNTIFVCMLESTIRDTHLTINSYNEGNNNIWPIFMLQYDELKGHSMNAVYHLL